jgi:hypothetical protein
VRLDREFVEFWGQRYLDEELLQRERDLFDKVGPVMRETGFGTAAQVGAIVAWKSPRTRTYFKRNDPQDVADLTRLAFAAPPHLRHRVLGLLHGVAPRVASAILTVYDPDQFTVFDFRAVESLHKLGHLDSPRVAEITYIRHVEECRSLATECGLPLRDLDRALWKWSKDDYPAEPPTAGLGSREPT